jgi:hypothetical protein
MLTYDLEPIYQANNIFLQVIVMIALKKGM